MKSGGEAMVGGGDRERVWGRRVEKQEWWSGEVRRVWQGMAGREMR